MPPRKRTSPRSTPARAGRTSRGPADQIRLQVAALQAVVEGIHDKTGIEGIIGRFEPGQIDPGILLALPPVVVTRPGDLLRLRFSFDNLRLDTVDGALVLTRARSNAAARLVVDHQPQHLVEEAGREQEVTVTWPDRPVQTRLSTHTRLVFNVGAAQVPWTLDGLLDACSTLPLVLTPNAQIEPSRRGFEVLPWRMLPGGLAAGVGLSVKVTAANAPAVAASLGTLQRTLRAARILDERAGTSAAIAAFGGMHASEVIGAIDQIGPGIVDLVRKPEPREPGSLQTSIELPWRLKLSPGPRGAWVHRTEPAEHDGRVELWHSRLGQREGTGAESVVREGDAYVRAVWARDFDQFPLALPSDKPAFPPNDGDLDQPGFTMSLRSRHRMFLVHETSNFALKALAGGSYRPPVVPVETLALTSLGGWLSSRLEISPVALPKGAFDIIEWTHRATMARDHYVKVVQLGYLYPFGHKAALITITERKFNPEQPGNPAYLLQREFIQVMDRSRSYTSTDRYLDQRHLDSPADVDRRLDLMMPFADVTILTAETPLLDPRSGDEGGGRLKGFPGCFVPTVEGDPFGFRIHATDRLGNVVEYPGPLLFVDKDRNEDGQATMEAVARAYHDISDPRRVTHELSGQRVAYAPDTFAGQPLDTTLATQRLRWDAAPHVGGAGNAQFHPMLRDAAAVVPSVNALAGRSDPILLRYPDHYSAKGLEANAAQVFLEVARKPGDPLPSLNFSNQAQRSGGFVTPDLAITGLSGTTGPIGGTIANAVSGATNPADFFAGMADKARLFGIVSLADLLAGLAPDAFPTFVADQVNTLTALQQDLGRVIALAGQLPGRVAATAEAGSAQAQAVVDTAVDVGARGAAVLGAMASFDPTAADAPLTTELDQLSAALAGLGSSLDAAAFLPQAVRGDAGVVVRRLREHLEVAGDVVDLLTQVANGVALPETVSARMHWSTAFKAWPDPAKAVFQPRVESGQTAATARTTLDLSVQVQAPTKLDKEPTSLATCSLTPFSLRLLGKDPFISLHVEKIEFVMETGKKADVNVVFRQTDAIEFGGPLRWVNALRSLIPFNGFSDPPYLDVTTAGIRAGFDLPLPDIPLGVLNLTQVSLGAEVNVPFLGESLDFRFYFCTRERPFHLTVWLFGGGGFFSITVTPEKCRILEAAFEFGACASLDFGVASGSIEVMAGIYFRLEEDNSQLSGYFRLRGEVDVLGLISASLELYLEITYEIESRTARGRAELTIEVEVLMFSTSVTIEVEKKFQGSDQDPDFAAVMGPAVGEPVETSPWHDYCTAFATA